MTSSIHTYQSTNPQIMLLNNKTKIMACKKHNKNKKPYKKIFIRPPSQLQNKWYFQYDIAQTPLLQTIATSASLDRMYMNSQSISTTLGFETLDTVGFTQHYWKDTGTQPYMPQPGQYLIAIPQGPTGQNISNVDITQCIILGNINDYTPGQLIGTVGSSVEPPSNWNITNAAAKKFYTAATTHIYWGNPFYKDYFYGDEIMAMSNKNLEELTKAFQSNSKLQANFTIKTQKHMELRYNPFADKGTGNIVYLKPINEHLHSTDWGPPTDKDVVCKDLPINIMLWGYLDFYRKCKEYNDIDTTCILVIQSPYFYPKNAMKFVVPLDYDFLYGNSPYFHDGNKTASDRANWHPKVRFQTRTINALACTSNGTTKLPPDVSTECHMKYCFYFKFGGEPPPMSILKNPEDQPKYAVPNNLLQTPSLQSPTTPLEQLLWKFDERRGLLTKRATKRITTHKDTQTDLLSITDPTTWCPTTLREKEETSESSTEEEETSTEERLLQQRRKQKHLRKLINRLLLRVTTLE